MKTVKRSVVVAMMMPVFFLPAKPAVASIADPFVYYNVFSAGDISYNHSEFEGTVGAGGQVVLTSVALSGLNTANRFSLHSGGNVSIKGGSHTGSIEAAGDVTLGSLKIHGNVYSGGTVANSAGGKIYGDASAQKINLGSGMSVTGTRQSGATYAPYADLAASTSYFRKYSHDVAAMGGTGANVTNTYGNLKTSRLSSGINVVTLSASELNNAGTFAVNGPADAILYINVPGAQVALNSTTWTYLGGINASDVLVNYFEASRLDLTGSNVVNIIAPLSFTAFYEGRLTGNLIVDDLEGNGQVSLGYFDHGEPVPEPSTLLLLLAGGIPFLLRKKLRSQFFN